MQIKLSKSAYDTIKEQIIVGKLKPGEPIMENRLIEELKISRTPIREALQKLEQDHLIRVYPRRGVIVREISPKDIKDIYSIREILEPFAASLALPNLSISELRKYHREFEKKNRNISLQEEIEIDHGFHQIIIEKSQNEYLIFTLANLFDHLRRIRNLYSQKLTTERENINIEHLRIINAVISGNKREVEKAIREHLNAAFKRLVAAVL